MTAREIKETVLSERTLLPLSVVVFVVIAVWRISGVATQVENLERRVTNLERVVFLGQQ